VSGSKPDVSVSLKPVGGSKEDRVYFMAGWRNDEGRITALKFDRRVRRMKLELDDGKVISIDCPQGGKPTHFIDFYDAAGREGGGGSGGGSKKSEEW
jgi:hypothetical protein